MHRSRGAPLEGARVLIVEDEFFLADDLAKALREAGGSPVGPANSVAQAEALIAREEVDAAILDLNLRGHMASEFIERLAATHMPCLIFSGYGDDAFPADLARIRRVEKPASTTSVLQSLADELTKAA